VNPEIRFGPPAAPAYNGVMAEPFLTQEIVAAIRSGDRSAFDALFERVGGKVYVYVFNRMGKRLRQVVEPEDVLQDVYAKAFQSFDDFVSGGAGSLARWMTGIARNHIRHLYAHHFEQEKRDPRRAVPLSPPGTSTAPGLDVPGPDPSPSRVIARNEEVRRVSEALAALPDAERDAILMHIEGVPVTEIARRLDVPRTTLLYRISSALRRLGSMLEE